MAPQLPQRRLSANAISSLAFEVCRRSPELIPPSKPTPRELKPLSDIDDQDCLRCQIPLIQFYRNNPSKANIDPVGVIRRALAETLVHFYPFAGRIREGANRKLTVDCTGEGVMFIEADADVALEDFEDALQPPFPCFDELLFDVPGSSGILNSPLLVIQVTRLKCGGFIFAIRHNHTMGDGTGISLFMKTVGDFARGANAPTIPPVWDRHLLRARVPARVTHTHPEYDDEAADTTIAVLESQMVQRSFFFGPIEISAIRRLVPPDIRSHSTISEVLTAFLWRSRTIALNPNPDNQMRIIYVVDARPKYRSLKPGYYGNAIALPAATSIAKDLTERPLEHALRLVQKTKYSVTEEYIRSVADFMATRGRPSFSMNGAYIISDVRRLGFREVDFGWGNAVYGGPAMAGSGFNFSEASSLIPSKSKKGEEGIVVPIWLPESAMERFVENLDGVLRNEIIT